MIYITQLIYLYPGKETVFHEFEDHVLPLLDRHQGILLYRVRPTQEAYVSSTGDHPYEIHLVSFPSEEALAGYLQDKDRTRFVQLKEQSVSHVLMVKGKRMG